jgi:hypothetical protein
MFLRTGCAVLLSVAVVLPASPAGRAAQPAPRSAAPAALLIPGNEPTVNHPDHGRLTLIREYQFGRQNPKRQAEISVRESPDLCAPPKLPTPVLVPPYHEVSSPADNAKPTVRPVLCAQPRAPPRPSN